MSPPRTVVTALGVKRPGPPRIDADPVEHGTRSQMSEMPQAVCFPHDDGEFAERVHALLDGPPGEEPFAAAVQALLRETHPLAVISARTQLGAVDGGLVWYVFRDGSAMPPVDGDTS